MGLVPHLLQMLAREAVFDASWRGEIVRFKWLCALEPDFPAIGERHSNFSSYFGANFFWVGHRNGVVEPTSSSCTIARCSWAERYARYLQWQGDKAKLFPSDGETAKVTRTAAMEECG